MDGEGASTASTWAASLETDRVVERLFASGTALRAVMDAMPAAVLVVDRGLRLLDANRAAEELMDSSTDHIVGKLGGDLLRCLNSVRSEGGCGTGSRCRDCVIRGAVGRAEGGEATSRQIVSMVLEQHGRVRLATFTITTTPMLLEERPVVLLVMEDVTELAELRKLLPMCSYCRKVRDDSEFWQDVEQYLSKHTALSFSHGVCPDCLREHFPEQAEEVLRRAGASDDEPD